MIRGSLKILSVMVAAIALSSCYGAKIFKGPINSENAALAADTIRTEQRRMAEQLDRIERRLDREGEERTAFQANTSVTLSELEEAVRVLVSRIDDSEQLMINRGGRDRTGGSRPATGAAGEDSLARVAEDVYAAAYMDVTRGNYELAARAFQDYLARFPTAPRAADANYYLGECHYANDRFPEAAAAFQRVVTDFPTTRLAPAAWLKLGRSYVQLEERGLAEKAFKSLIEKHPNTEEAQQAQAALGELGG